MSVQDIRAEEGHYSHMTLEEYIKFMGGTRPISRILIANNGIAAVKAIRSIRKWAYETFSNDKMIQFVVMATPEDLRANAEYIHLADEFVPVPGGSNNNNYANIRLITEIAENTNCHAVWAGWGHASENPKLPDLLAATKSKIVWIGPPSHAMRALGDKIGSTLIAQSAGVPCMPWSGDGLVVDYKTSGIPDDLYQKSCVETVEECRAQAERIGFPIMIKASEGGGGKGIRRVESLEELAFAFRQVQGEVPGSPIFIMKLAGTCRHLEVQLLCDSWGHSIAVFGRDCSIQRRHQKIIEEGPVVAAPPDVWEQMEKSAVRLAKEVGYVGAGTVEYLYMEDGTYSFLELNPRLQVEHPVTELISGVNLPAAQLQIAMGIPLQRLPGIRKMYGESVLTQTEIDFDTRKAQTLPLHVMACRITAENPDEKFQPTSGVIQELNFRSTPDVWGYFSVSAKGLVHEFADSQFGHMFAVGPTREIARKNMVLALKELEIRGDIRTTIEYLRVMIEHEDFKRNHISTTWLEGILANHSITAEQPSDYLATVCGALYRAHAYCQQQETDYTNTLLKGHLPSSKVYQQLVNYDCDLIYHDTKYKFEVTKCGPSTYDLTILTPKKIAPPQQTVGNNASTRPGSAINIESNEDAPNPASPSNKAPEDSKDISTSTSPSKAMTEVTQPTNNAPVQWTRSLIASCDIHNLSDGGFLVLLNGKKHVIHGREFPSGLRLTVDTMTCLFQHEYDPTSLKSETQGKLVQYLVDTGAHVNKGDPVCELEVMKMYITIRAPESGIVTQSKSIGTVVESGDLLATFRLDHPELVKKATIFNGTFPQQEFVLEQYTQPPSANLFQQFRFYDLRLRRLLSGYVVNNNVVSDTIQYLTQVLADPLLPAVQFNELASNAAGRVPAPLLDKLVEIVEQYQSAVNVYQQLVDLNAATSTTSNNSSASVLCGASPLLLNSTKSAEVNSPQLPEFPIAQLTALVEQFLEPESAVTNNVNIVAVKAALDTYGITQYLEQYKSGTQIHTIQTLFAYIYEFLNVEESFQLPLDIQATSMPSLEDVLHHLRKVHKDNLSYVSTLARAHYQFLARSSFISQLIDTLLQSYASNLNAVTPVQKKNDPACAVDTTIREEWTALLHRLASLHAKDAIVVSLKARQALVSLRLPSQKTRLYTTMKVLQNALEKRQALLPPSGTGQQVDSTAPKTVNEDKVLSPMSQSSPANLVDIETRNALSSAAISDLVDQSQPIDDVILHFLSHPSDEIRALAAEAYVRRAFQHFSITGLSVYNNPTLKQLTDDKLDENQKAQIFGQTPSLLCRWEFFMEQKGAHAKNDNAGAAMLSPVTIGTHKSGLGLSLTPDLNNSQNQLMRRIDSLTNLPQRMLEAQQSQLFPSNTPSQQNLPSTCDEEDGQTCPYSENSDSEDENSTPALVTPGGMYLQSPTAPTVSDSLINGVSSEFPVSSTLKPVRRMGVMAHFNSIEDLRTSFSTVLASFHNAPQNRHLPRSIRKNSSVHVLYVYITAASYPSVQALSNDLQPIIDAYKPLLTQYKIRRLTFICPLVKPNVKIAGGSASTALTSNLHSSSMTPVFSSTPFPTNNILMAQLSLPTPLSLSKQFSVPTTTPCAAKQSSDDFLKNSILVSPSYVTFRCSNIEDPAAASTTGGNTPASAMTTPMAKHFVSLAKPVEYVEDRAIRQIEPNNALHLQLDRLSNYDYQLIPTTNRMVHLFGAIPFPKNESGKPGNAPAPAPARPVYDGRRFFARVLVRRLNSVQRSLILNGKAVLESTQHGELDVTVPTTGTADAHPETEVAFVEALNSLEIALTTANALNTKTGNNNTPDILKRPGGNGKWLFNHIFVNVLVDISVETQTKNNDNAPSATFTNGSLLPDETLVNIEYVDSIIRSLTRRYADKIRRLHVTNVEFAITVRVKSPTSDEINSVPIRFICENPSSLVLHIAPFYEQYDPATNKVLLVPIVTRSLTNITFDKFRSMIFKNPQNIEKYQPQLLPPQNSAPSYLAGVHGYTDADASYPTTFPYLKQRLTATSLDTIWCFDFIEIFEKAIRRSWRTTLLSYVNILANIAFIQQPAKTTCVATAHYTKTDQSLIMSLLLTVLSIMFNYTDISLESAATSIRALIQAPLSVFKSAGIALILANNLTENASTLNNLQKMVDEHQITQNDFICIQQIAEILPKLPTDVINTCAEFAQIAIRIPSTFIKSTELALKANPNYQPNTIGTDTASQQLHNGYHAYSSKYVLEPVQRDPGLNKCAMVAFDITMYTPECLEFDINLQLQDMSRKNNSRDMIVIANDITIEAGSFGIEENILFDLASQRARKYGIPRIYLSANSGARIGLADELKGKFKVGFIEGDQEYSKGFEYIYLTEKLYNELKASVVCNKITVNLPNGDSEDRYVITDVIGKKDGIHAECLRASGAIAGETSQAYQDIFTLTYVTCRSVGIGAYVARLSSRVIQKADPAMPLLLTGFQALNKLLGKTVYTSNVQLGGPDVMYTNGVSNLIVPSDLHGAVSIIQWLSYTPVRKLNYVDAHNCLVKTLNNTAGAKYIAQRRPLLAQTIDPVARIPTFTPTSRTHLYDPRHLLVGTTTHNPVMSLYQQFITFKDKLATMYGPAKKQKQDIAADGTILMNSNSNNSIPLDDITSTLSALNITPITSAPLTGLFDQFSFFEVLSGWAKGIVAGRARLGGIPVGVLTVDPRTIETTIAADPAVSDSNEITMSRAGQVLFPESSFKFAQAIFDMKNEDLPIVSLISFRGFSGGASDMQKEILKYGSYIVDALHNYTQPIIMYLPPFATLRGGAWVVIDPTINFDFMEMYSDNNASGGVLEPEGIVDVKFRREQILAEMRRCDPLLIQYQQQLTIARASGANSANDVAYIQNLINQRETALFPMYLQLAVHIADKHDTPVRMLKKGVINDIVSWQNAREAFYWRVNAKQYEQEYVMAILSQLDERLNALSSSPAVEENEFLVNNITPGSTYAYQHKALGHILTSTYGVSLPAVTLRNTPANPANVTTTNASTIQLARSLLYIWFTKDLVQFLKNKHPSVSATLPTTIPSYNTNINDATNNQDKIFASFIINNKDIMVDFITQQLTTLFSAKVKYQLQSLLASFDDNKNDLIDMINNL